MRYTALATDYDGTIAHDGVVDAATLAALRRAVAGGIRLLLVTGRDLPALHETFTHLALFERVVAENGAVLYTPATAATRSLAPPPPAALLDELARLGVPVVVGHSVVATFDPHGPPVVDAIRRLGLDWHLILNKGAVMALPAGVDKATGMAVALVELGVPAERVVGVGDAENDRAMLRACGLGVAVANALPSVRAVADWVTAGERGTGVAELIDRMLAQDWEPRTRGWTPRRSGQ